MNDRKLKSAALVLICALLSGCVSPPERPEETTNAAQSGTTAATVSVEPAATDSGYSCSGERVAIIGDSISTFVGFVPTGTGYAAFYTGENCGVSSAEQTWWGRLLAETGMVLTKNNSVSGSCVTSGSRPDRLEASSPLRTGDLTDGHGNPPDHIIIFMGTNDYALAAGLGTYDGHGSFPTDTTTFREAYAVMLSELQKNYPKAKIYCCTLTHTGSKSKEFREVDYNQNGELKAEWNDAIRQIATLFNCEIIELASCGINAANLPYYSGDDAVDEDGVSGEGLVGRGLHPNAAGHELIFEEVLKHFE